jgi:predicted RNase H-like HicB family nuclease
MKHKYKVDVKWSDEDEVYVARVPKLDGVVTHGSTVVEASERAEAAIKLHLESLKKHNQPIPKP